MICFQETWLDDKYDDLNEFEIEDYQSDFIIMGRGRGIATYYKKQFTTDIEVNEKNLQIRKLKSDTVDIIVLYKSQEETLNNLEKILINIVDTDKPTVIIGDFNTNFLDKEDRKARTFLKANSFEKLVNGPTHKDGNCLDQAFVRDVQKVNKYSIQVEGKYYSDHKALSLIIER